MHQFSIKRCMLMDSRSRLNALRMIEKTLKLYQFPLLDNKESLLLHIIQAF